MSRILINKSNDMLRVARTSGQKLYDLEIEDATINRVSDSICNAEVVSIEPSLNAAFANFGAKRNGFLPLKEIAPEYYSDKAKNSDRRPNIKDILFEGQKILIQVNKEERGTKGAALSTFITLAGCYLVLMPNNPSAGGISRRIEGEERDELKRVMNALTIPKDMGVIVRTAGIGKSTEELQWDLDVLLKLWDSIQNASKQHGAPVLIHQESDIAIRAVRDHLRPEITEILVDDEEIYKKVYSYIERVRPDFLDRVKFYSDKNPLFSRFQLEKQIESAYQRKVRLPSGGEIVIDPSEALISIDVNSAQSTKGGNIEETALNTNLEAADEIAKQLRIRDLAGLIVIDFIDMDRDDNNHKVEDRMREALRSDRARVQTARLSRFGLLEMSRQRLRPMLNEASLIVCPRCHGQGSIRNVLSQAQSILHLIEENAQKKNINQVRVQLPIDLATYLLNEKRQSISKIEAANCIAIIIIANPYLQTPQYEIECLNSAKASNQKSLSYEMVSTPSVEYSPGEDKTNGTTKREAAVGDVLPDTSVPQPTQIKNPGFFAKLIKQLFGKKKKSAKRRQTRSTKSPQRRQSNPRYNNKNQRTQRSSRDQYRGGRTRRTNAGGTTRTNRRDDNDRTDNRTNQRDENDRTDMRTNRRDDSDRTDKRTDSRDENAGRTDNRRTERKTPNRSRQRSDSQTSRTPRQRQTQRRTTSSNTNREARPAPEKNPVTTKTSEVTTAPEKKPVTTQTPKTTQAPQTKQAPRHAHSASTRKETSNEFKQVETAHKPMDASSNKTEERSAEKPQRKRPQRAKKPIDKTSSEEFEMIETKN